MDSRFITAMSQWAMYDLAKRSQFFRKLKKQKHMYPKDRKAAGLAEPTPARALQDTQKRW
jgi:hypothetical protein